MHLQACNTIRERAELGDEKSKSLVVTNEDGKPQLVVDEAVYTTNRHLRVSGSSKFLSNYHLCDTNRLHHSQVNLVLQLADASSVFPSTLPKCTSLHDQLEGDVNAFSVDSGKRGARLSSKPRELCAG
jgi:hypothetical protein